jgi:hypothetical protein
MTKEGFAERYKIIDIEKQGNVLVVRLYRSENRDDKIYFVRLIFVDNKLFYSGDMGTYVFGRDICYIFTFFKGDHINEGYWSQKCEASSYPIYPNEVDEEIVEELVKEYVCDLYRVENYEELDDEIKDVITDKFQFGMESNDIRAYDEIYEFLKEEFDNSNLNEIVADIIDSAKSISPNYVYACELIQWVENNLEDWCKERNINYEELLNQR